MADNADLAQVSGINTEHVVRITWIIAGGACAAWPARILRSMCR